MRPPCCREPRAVGPSVVCATGTSRQPDSRCFARPSQQVPPAHSAAWPASSATMPLRAAGLMHCVPPPLSAGRCSSRVVARGQLDETMADTWGLEAKASLMGVSLKQFQQWAARNPAIIGVDPQCACAQQQGCGLQDRGPGGCPKLGRRQPSPRTALPRPFAVLCMQTASSPRRFRSC